MSAVTLSTIAHFAIVGVGGALGAMSRYGVEQLGCFDDNPYYYTVAINITGCLTIGILWAVFNHMQLSQGWFLLVMTGFLGGYTTYSAFTLDAMKLVQIGMYARALFYIGITIVGGLGACALGLFGTERLLKWL